jgi:prepilin-type N-terminal cleavage/methylation domain-containing protein
MMFKTHNEGFTLLELVIVLAILAIVTALATREVGHVQDQRRFEVTQRTLENIREVVLGVPNDRAPDGTRMQGGFVADTGRLPGNLSELWTNAPTFHVRQAIVANMAPGYEALADSDILVAGGRRSPYVRLPIGSSELRDGWGNVFTNWQDASGWHIEPVVEPPVPYNQHVSLTINPNDYTASAWGYVTVINDSTNAIAGSVVVRIYGPSRDHEDKIEAIVSAPIAFSISAMNTAQSSWSIVDLSMGPQAVRAYGDFGATSLVMAVTLSAGPNGPFNFSLQIR